MFDDDVKADISSGMNSEAYGEIVSVQTQSNAANLIGHHSTDGH